MPDLQVSKTSRLERKKTLDLEVCESSGALELVQDVPSYGRLTIGAAVILSALCFVTFQHGDILHTAGCAFSMLRGHARDFYDYNAAFWGYPANYLPSTYWLYAVVALPLKVLHLLPDPGLPSIYYAWYFKFFNTLAYVGTAVHIQAIALQAHGKPRIATFVAALWLTTPVAFFSQFIFGQYDILTLFFFTWSLRFYFQGRLPMFTALVAVALTFKYFPLFCYLPLLLLAEKRIARVLSHGAAVAVPILAESLLYRNQLGFTDGVFGFRAANYVFTLIYDTGGVQTSLVFFIWFAVCTFAWLSDLTDTHDKSRQALFFALAGVAPAFILASWHPPWPMFVTPLLCLIAGFHVHRRRLMVLDVVMASALYGYSCTFFPNNVDHQLMNRGIFGSYNPSLGAYEKVVHMIPDLVMSKRMLFPTVFSAILLAYVFASRQPSATDVQGGQAQTDVTQQDIFGLWVRFFVGVGLWVILAARSYIMTFRQA